MSSILKALKKLEEEKISLEEEGRRLNLSSEILRQQRHAGNSPWLLRGFAALAVVVIILLTALLMSRPAEKTQQNSGQHQTSPPPQPTLQQQPAHQTQLLPNQSTVQPADAATAAKAVGPLPREARSLPEPVRPAAVQKLPLPELPGSEPLPVRDVQPKQLPKSTTQTVESPEPRLTLSGIAWNKDSAERLAIINGQPASTGSHIGGAVVEEILPDRVRLSSKGKVFELSIGRPDK